MPGRTMGNPLDFERDLDRTTLCELEVLTRMARTRLEEREISIGKLKTSWLAGEGVPRPPLMIPDYPPRLVGADMFDYCVSTVTHYRSYCAFLARFGQDNVSMHTITWEYDFLREIGGELVEIRHKSPETAKYPIQGPEDLDRLPDLDFDDLVRADAALVRHIHEQLGDLIGPGIYVSLDPFSQVCSLLRKPELLMMDVIDSPQFVHRMCQYMTGIEREVLRRLLNAAPLIFFSPGFTLMLSPAQFEEFALPYVEQLIADFPGVPWLMGSGGQATHLVEPLMKSTVPIPFIDAASDLARAVELAKQYHKPTTVLFPRSVLMRGDRDEIRRTTRELLSTAKDIPFLYWTEAILGGDVPNPSIDLFLEAYRDYACYPLQEHLQEAVGGATPVAEAQTEAIAVEELVWEADGEEAFKKAVPFMFRKQAKRELEKMIAAKGIRRITVEVFEQAKKEAGF
jgi:uroporphyrinogen-III decarboxylase